MKKRPRFHRCSVPLSSLDREVEKRVYLQGESTCRLDFQGLTVIVDDAFKEQYKRFIRVSLNKGQDPNLSRKPQFEEKVGRRRRVKNRTFY